MFTSNIVGAIGALAIVTATASAADLAPIVAPVPIVQPDPWSGGHIGVAIGYGWANFDTSGTPGFFSSVESRAFSVNDGGFMLSALGGYDWRRDNWLFGADLELGYSWIDSGFLYGTNPTGPSNDFGDFDYDFYAIGAVRGGYIINERFLAYLKAGIATAKVDTAIGDLAGGVPNLAENRVISQDKWLWGWALGGGLEVALNGNWSSRLEYLYVDLGSQSGAGVATCGGCGSYSWEYKHKLQTVKIAFSRRFSTY